MLNKKEYIFDDIKRPERNSGGDFIIKNGIETNIPIKEMPSNFTNNNDFINNNTSIKLKIISLKNNCHYSKEFELQYI